MSDAEFSLRRIAVPAFGPTALWSVGIGRSCRSSPSAPATSGLGLGRGALRRIGTVSELVSAVPAGVVVDRLGERRALVLAGLADAAASLLALLAPSLWVLALAVVLTGPTGAVFPPRPPVLPHRRRPGPPPARAMSTLGGVAADRAVRRAVRRRAPRRGLLAAGGLRGGRGRRPGRRGARGGLPGPRGARPRTGSRGAGRARAGARGRPPAPDGPAHRRGRGARDRPGALLAVVVVPLWAEHVGLTAAQTSLVFGVAGLVEVLLFYPAGSLMDRRGRIWVALPVTVLLGIGLLVLPLTSTLLAVGAVAVVMAVGNGLGSGIVMTLGADAAPEQGRAPFLGLWRLLSLVGHNGPPSSSERWRPWRRSGPRASPSGSSRWPRGVAAALAPALRARALSPVGPVGADGPDGGSD